MTFRPAVLVLIGAAMLPASVAFAQGTSVNWLADTMDAAWHDVMGQTPNSELVVGPDGVVIASANQLTPGSRTGRRSARWFPTSRSWTIRAILRVSES